MFIVHKPLNDDNAQKASGPVSLPDMPSPTATRILLEGMLFAAVFAWSDLFKEMFDELIPGKAGIVAQLAFALILTGVIVYLVEAVR